MSDSKLTEQRVAEFVIAYLEAAGADVYQEVTCGSGVADIVARVGAELWIIEVKIALSLRLISQAMERRRHAHRVYVASPRTKNMGDVGVLLEELGIGMLEVSSPWFGSEPRVRELLESRRFNSRPVALTARLVPEHKTHAKAGAVGAGRWTPFRNTCEQVARYVRENPGATLKDIVGHVTHHYSSDRVARSSLAKWAQDGVIDGVVARNNDGHIKLYAKERT